MLNKRIREERKDNVGLIEKQNDGSNIVMRYEGKNFSNFLTTLQFFVYTFPIFDN